MQLRLIGLGDLHFTGTPVDFNRLDFVCALGKGAGLIAFGIGIFFTDQIVRCSRRPGDMAPPITARRQE